MQGGALGTHPRWRPRSTSAPIGSVSPWGVYLYMSIMDHMLSTGSRDTLISYTDHSAPLKVERAYFFFSSENTYVVATLFTWPLNMILI